jgi:hypothetical protein
VPTSHPADCTLAYIDQASFLGLRALGRGPLVQFSWIYERPVDLDGLRRLHRNLGHGLLGRLIERSAVPFGRHHWVAWAGPADLAVTAAPRPRDQATAWLDEQLALPIDPEHGPGLVSLRKGRSCADSNIRAVKTFSLYITYSKLFFSNSVTV